MTLARYTLLNLIAASMILLSACRDTVTGTVAVKGNEPNTYVTLITPEHGQLRISGVYTTELRERLQGKKIRASGEIKIADSPGGFSAIEITSYTAETD